MTVPMWFFSYNKQTNRMWSYAWSAHARGAALGFAVASLCFYLWASRAYKTLIRAVRTRYPSSEAADAYALAALSESRGIYDAAQLLRVWRWRDRRFYDRATRRQRQMLRRISGGPKT